MDDNLPENLPEPANLRFLRRLVTVLTATMLLGVVVVVGLLVTRLSGSNPDLPASVTLPIGASAVAFTQGDDWYAVVTDQNQILIFGRLDGQLRQTINVE